MLQPGCTSLLINSGFVLLWFAFVVVVDLYFITHTMRDGAPRKLFFDF